MRKNERAKSKAASKTKRPSARKTSTKRARPGFRLPTSAKPLDYRLHLRVDPQRSAEYSGEVEIDLELAEQHRWLDLHAAELVLHRAALIAHGGEAREAALQTHPKHERLRVVCARPLPKGRATLRIAFSGTLRGDLRGLYAASSGARKYAFTQLEAADARRFFPCFDEPAFKARFTLSVTTAREHEVISNMPVERVVPHEDGQKTVHFERTPRLSTYLVALAVGELAVSEPVHAGEIPIRIVHVPGGEHLTGFAKDTARECLTRLSRYFGLPYPYAKLDLVAVPDFEIGAMENAGAVFFRETLLLVDEASVSLAEKKRAAEVICHELAHMWYGNLVTMRWWDDLWLNEAFATWMAFAIVDAWRPEWKMWNDFGHSRNSALDLDALDNTHPIYTQVGTPADATENFDLITYEKGAAVVRMLERYLGEKTFQRGVRKYIRRHREGNTVAADLWRALEEAARQDVRGVVRAFIEQPGFPLVRLSHETSAGRTRIVLEQERFAARGPSRKASPGVRWAIPWVGRAGVGSSQKLVRHLLRKRREHVTLEGRKPGFLYGNAEEGGFFLPLHDERDLPALIAALPSLPVSERLGLAHHQWALVRAGYASLDTFLSLLPAYANEHEADVLHALGEPCHYLLDRVVHAQDSRLRAALRAFIAALFRPALSALGYDAADGEDHETRLRRAELVTLVALIAEDQAASAALDERARAYLLDRRAIDANLAAAVLVIGARRADAARLGAYLSASTSDPTPQERRRFRMALGEVREAGAVREVAQLCLGEQVPTQDVALLLARMLGNSYARHTTWDFIRDRWPEVRERMPAMLVSRLVDATPALGAPYAAEVGDFFERHPIPTAARALRQAKERFRLDEALRKRSAPVLRRWYERTAAAQSD